MVNVELFKQDGKLSFIVEDNGIGFDSKSIDKKNSFGLLGIKERLAVLGGELIIDSYPGKGTKIFITVKL
jgi:Signal transduction histidine kinase